jgi:hypothetical protein
VLKWCLLFPKEAEKDWIADTDIEFCIGALQYYIKFWLFSAEVAFYVIGRRRTNGG